jgi:hypothetical protein
MKSRKINKIGMIIEIVAREKAAKVMLKAVVWSRPMVNW